LCQGAIKGFSKLSLWQYSKIGIVMVKNKLSYKNLVDLWYKHVTNWGDETTKYTFKGYRGGQLVSTKDVQAGMKYHLEVSTECGKLIVGPTYDVARISIRLVDEFGFAATYAQTAATVSVSSNLEVLGPGSFTLTGGQTCVYVRTKTMENGIGKISVQAPYYGSVDIKLPIEFIKQ